jgi:hypothetical protein
LTTCGGGPPCGPSACASTQIGGFLAEVAGNGGDYAAFPGPADLLEAWADMRLEVGGDSCAPDYLVITTVPFCQGPPRCDVDHTRFVPQALDLLEAYVGRRRPGRLRLSRGFMARWARR